MKIIGNKNYNIYGENMTGYIYAEYAIGGIAKRNNIENIKDFKLGNSKTDCYRSIFLFDKDIKNFVETSGSVSKYEGPHVADEVVFDFDGQDLNQVKKEVTEFCNHLYTNYKINIGLVNIYFSGNKGFHIQIPIECFSSNINPKEKFWEIYRSISLEIASDFHIDSKIYERRRLFRIANTLHSASNLYKIPLSYNELSTLSIEEIKELAKNPRVLSASSTEYMVIKALNSVYEKWDQYNNDLGNEEKEISPTLISLLDGVNYGERNNAAIKIAGLFISKGMDEIVTKKIMCLWNEKNNPPLKYDEINILCYQAYRRYGTIIPKDIKVFDMQKSKEAYVKYVADLQNLKVLTGYTKIDKKIRGISPGETCCVIGKTEVGKSVFLQNIGINYAQQSKLPVLFFSLEMPVTSVYERTMQIETELSGPDIERLFIQKDDKIESMSKMIGKNIPNFFVVDRSGLTLRDISQIISYSEENIYHNKTGLVLIDYLGLIQENGNDIYQQVSKVARGIKDIAKEKNIPVIFLSQVNKNYSEYSELELGAARDSGVVDEASDFVLGLWRNPETNKDKPTDKSLFLGILKNRKGGKGKIKISMDKVCLRMTEVSV